MQPTICALKINVNYLMQEMSVDSRIKIYLLQELWIAELAKDLLGKGHHICHIPNRSQHWRG